MLWSIGSEVSPDVGEGGREGGPLARSEDCVRSRPLRESVPRARVARKIAPHAFVRGFFVPRPKKTSSQTTTRRHHQPKQPTQQEDNLTRRSSDSRPCPNCEGRRVEPCVCTRWSDGDAGCSSCGNSGMMACRACRGGGTAVPIKVTLPVRADGAEEAQAAQQGRQQQ